MSKTHLHTRKQHIPWTYRPLPHVHAHLHIRGWNTRKNTRADNATRGCVSSEYRHAQTRVHTTPIFRWFYRIITALACVRRIKPRSEVLSLVTANSKRGRSLVREREKKGTKSVYSLDFFSRLTLHDFFVVYWSMYIKVYTHFIKCFIHMYLIRLRHEDPSRGRHRCTRIRLRDNCERRGNTETLRREVLETVCARECRDAYVHACWDIRSMCNEPIL